ncbi:hypothetical protein B0H10DRAFT_1938642 [Mycena sp. CBHHK59/15]|nr:hypothetical protein B0H10DRAFT_1938642 [Mycena sp. CBHHK59/15]
MANNGCSNHYREHTRQQDRWTVLAPPPAAQAAPDLPPPYTPEAAARIAPAAAAHPATTGTALAFDIPTNTNVIGAARVTRSKKYGHAVHFNVAFVEICDIMGLDSSTAQIGYNWDNEKYSAPVHALLTAADWKDCLESGIGQMERVRTRKVTCLIKNLKLPEETAAVAKMAKKHKAAAAPSSPAKTFDFTKEYRQLKSHLFQSVMRRRHGLLGT